MTVCKRVVYTGRVQGVGFRYTVHRIAACLPVSGYVRNVADGSVELVAEGDPSAVDDLLQRVARQMTGCIERAAVQDWDPEGHRGFTIKY
jgi:acylphosphatase